MLRRLFLSSGLIVTNVYQLDVQHRAYPLVGLILRLPVHRIPTPDTGIPPYAAGSAARSKSIEGQSGEGLL